MIEKTLTLPETFPLTSLFGLCDRYQRRVSDTLGVRIWSRGNDVYVSGQSNAVDTAVELLRLMKEKSLNEAKSLTKTFSAFSRRWRKRPSLIRWVESNRLKS